MREQVIRHRGQVRDENGKLTPEEPDKPLTALNVAPGAGSRLAERARDGETTAFTVYLPLGTDIVDTDELTVRQKRYSILVNDWSVSRFDGRPTGRGGLEVVCTRGQG